jgi:hypothetical protein
MCIIYRRRYIIVILFVQVGKKSSIYACIALLASKERKQGGEMQ